MYYLLKTSDLILKISIQFNVETNKQTDKQTNKQTNKQTSDQNQFKNYLRHRTFQTDPKRSASPTAELRTHISSYSCSLDEHNFIHR